MAKAIRVYGILSLALICSCCDSSTNHRPDNYWAKTYGGELYDVAHSIIQLEDGGFIIAGETESFGSGSEDIYLLKIDVAGNEIWYKTFGDIAFDEGTAVTHLMDGGLAVIGRTTLPEFGTKNIYLIRTDESGNQEWTKKFDDVTHGAGMSLTVTGTGGLVITGYTQLAISSPTNLFLAETDSAGGLLWAKTYGGDAEEIGYAVCPTADGGYVIVGGVWPGGLGNRDVYLLKVDAFGEFVWDNTYGGSVDDLGRDIICALDGGYVITGYSSSSGAGSWDVYLLKTDARGNVEWEKTIGGAGQDRGFAIAGTADGYIITGQSNSFSSGDYDAYLVKTDAAGNVLWERTFGGSGDESGNTVVTTTDGGIVMAGMTWSLGAGAADVYVLKLNNNGQL